MKENKEKQSILPFEVGKKYNFFDDGKITPSRHYIATVTDIIPIEKFNNRVGIQEAIENIKDLIPHLYAPNPEWVIICSIPEYCRGPFILIKMNDTTDNYFTILDDSYWCGKLCTTQWCIDNIINNKYIENDDFKKDIIL